MKCRRIKIKNVIVKKNLKSLSYLKYVGLFIEPLLRLQNIDLFFNIIIPLKKIVIFLTVTHFISSKGYLNKSQKKIYASCNFYLSFSNEYEELLREPSNCNPYLL